MSKNPPPTHGFCFCCGPVAVECDEEEGHLVFRERGRGIFRQRGLDRQAATGGGRSFFHPEKRAWEKVDFLFLSRLTTILLLNSLGLSTATHLSIVDRSLVSLSSPHVHPLLHFSRSRNPTHSPITFRFSFSAAATTHLISCSCLAGGSSALKRIPPFSLSVP